MALTKPQATILGGDTLSTSPIAFNPGVPIIENSTIINTSYCVTTGSNAHSIGPITVSVGAAVVVPVGSVWTII
jgi:hypothetical protein